MILPSLKRCTMCGEAKAVSEYSPSRGGKGIHAECRACSAARARAWRAANRPPAGCVRCGAPRDSPVPGTRLCHACRTPFEKRCVTCGEMKAISEYPRNRLATDGRSSKCAECGRRYNREYARREESRVRARERSLKKYYGLTLEHYNDLAEKQGGMCGICGGDGVGKTLAVDHDHRCCPGRVSCGRCVRGLLCHGCNTGNNWDTVPDWPAQAAAYLSRFGAPSKDRTVE